MVHTPRWWLPRRSWRLEDNQDHGLYLFWVLFFLLQNLLRRCFSATVISWLSAGSPDRRISFLPVVDESRFLDFSGSSALAENFLRSN
jgi:hypothetical protein